jgi:heat shock protein HtpX
MVWLRRLSFFLVLNIVVMLTLSLVTSLLGIQPYLNAQGMNYGALMVFCLVWGMGGAFISLLLSKVMAKWTMGVKVIDPGTTNANERELLQTVYRLARSAGISKMPEVGIYGSPEVNAFATGPTRNNSLVAVSSGLLHSMDQRSVEGVLGHEVAHIANGDMVTMTLLQGVVNAFVMALARIIAFAIDNALRGDRDNGRGLGSIGYFVVVFALELLLFIPGSMVIAYYSRFREFRADRDGARFSGRENMISALRSLKRAHEVNMSPEVQSAPAYASMKISGSRTGRFAQLFSTHPPLDVRIARLERGQ